MAMEQLKIKTGESAGVLFKRDDVRYDVHSTVRQELVLHGIRQYVHTAAQSICRCGQIRRIAKRAHQGQRLEEHAGGVALPTGRRKRSCLENRRAR